MPIVRLEVFKALGAAIETAVPELAGKVKVGQASSGTEQTYPTLTIVPGKFMHEPFDEYEHATVGDPADGNVVYNVGELAGFVALRIVATTPSERYALEQKVANLFLSQERRAGILVVDVTACPDLSAFVASFIYDSNDWVNVDAFDRKLESVISVNGIVPALVARTGVYEIDELVLGMTEDFDTAFNESTLAPPGVPTVQIHEDGSITPWA
jgi:hypothetical protein